MTDDLTVLVQRLADAIQERGRKAGSGEPLFFDRYNLERTLAAVLALPEPQFNWRERLGNLVDAKHRLGNERFGKAVIDLLYEYDAVVPAQPRWCRPDESCGAEAAAVLAQPPQPQVAYMDSVFWERKAGEYQRRAERAEVEVAALKATMRGLPPTLAAGLLMRLKDECEAQHARADAAEAKLAELERADVLAQPPQAAVVALVERLETYYDFECTGGPLKNCVEWQQLKAAVLAGGVPRPQMQEEQKDTRVDGERLLEGTGSTASDEGR